MAAVIRLSPDILRPEAELAAFLASAAGEGAVVSFVGLARPTAKSGEALTQLFLDHYPGMTEASIEAIAQNVLERFEVSHVLVVHRCGMVEPGEAIVFAAAAAKHRRAAFLAADCLMDRLKSEAAFWKREDGPGGSHWIEPTPADNDDLLRWSE